MIDFANYDNISIERIEYSEPAFKKFSPRSDLTPAQALDGLLPPRFGQAPRLRLGRTKLVL